MKQEGVDTMIEKSIVDTRHLLPRKNRERWKVPIWRYTLR